MMRMFAAIAVVLGMATVGWAGEAAKGKALYETRCSFCHGPSGKGDGPAGMALKPPPTNFASPAYWETAKPLAMKMVIKNGKPGTAMVPFAQTLNDGEIDDVVSYLQTLGKKP